MKRVRFWLAKIIHEEIGHRKPAQALGERIVGETERWNYEYGKWHCFSCGNEKLVRDIRGSDGIFTWTTIVYRCTACQNVQEEPNEHRFLFQVLGYEKIVEDGDGKYRYTILTDGQWIFLIMFAFIAASVVFVLSLR